MTMDRDTRDRMVRNLRQEGHTEEAAALEALGARERQRETQQGLSGALRSALLGAQPYDPDAEEEDAEAAVIEQQREQQRPAQRAGGPRGLEQRLKARLAGAKEGDDDDDED
jgi:hypothetical protein